MVFIDASFYLSLLFPKDSNHKKAIKLGSKYEDDYVTTQAVLGEVLTVGSMRFDRKLAIEFVGEVLASDTKVVLETKNLMDLAWKKFKKIKDKNVSWVDCFSFAVMEKLVIKDCLSFDRHFKRYNEGYV